MDDFVIPHLDEYGRVEFFGRVPEDRSKELFEFGVRLIDDNLSACFSVLGGYAALHPAGFFADMAAKWAGWNGEIVWEPLFHELTLSARHDGLGIRIAVELWNRCDADHWRARTIVMTEAGQLERLARQAARFFGR